MMGEGLSIGLAVGVLLTLWLLTRRPLVVENTNINENRAEAHGGVATSHGSTSAGSASGNTRNVLVVFGALALVGLILFGLLSQMALTAVQLEAARPAPPVVVSPPVPELAPLTWLAQGLPLLTGFILLLFGWSLLRGRQRQPTPVLPQTMRTPSQHSLPAPSRPQLREGQGYWIPYQFEQGETVEAEWILQEDEHAQ